MAEAGFGAAFSALGCLQLVLMAWSFVATRQALRQWRRADQAVRDRHEATRHVDLFWRLCREAEKAGRDPRLDRRAQAAYRLHMTLLYGQKAS